MFWKIEIEKNTMQISLDQFNESGEREKKTIKMVQFCWFFELSPIELSDFYHFCTRYFIYCNDFFCSVFASVKQYSVLLKTSVDGISPVYLFKMSSLHLPQFQQKFFKFAVLEPLYLTI